MIQQSLPHQVRALLIVDGFRETALFPAPLNAIHAASYFVDVFAGLWDARSLSDTVLKTRRIPRNALFQNSVDRLVGRAVLIASDVRYNHESGPVVLDARYSLNDSMASDVLGLIRGDEFWATERTLVGEVTLGIGAVTSDRVPRTVAADATYADPLLDYNTLVDLRPDQGNPSKTRRASDELALLGVEAFGRKLSVPELTALYLRHLVSYTVDPA